MSMCRNCSVRINSASPAHTLVPTRLVIRPNGGSKMLRLSRPIKCVNLTTLSLAVGVAVTALQLGANVHAQVTQIRNGRQAIAVPDAISIDNKSEAIFARIDDQASVEQQRRNRQALRLLIESPSNDLVLRDSFQVNSNFAIKRFASPKQLAATRLFSLERPLEDTKRNPTRELASDDFDDIFLRSAISDSPASSLIELIDALIDRGWTVAGRSLLYRIDDRLQLTPTFQPHSTDSTVASIPDSKVEWIDAVRNSRQTPIAPAKSELTERLMLEMPTTQEMNLSWDELEIAQLWMRLVYCSLLEADRERFDFEAGTASELFGSLPFVPHCTNQNELDTQRISATSIAQTVDAWRQQFDNSAASGSLAAQPTAAPLASFARVSATLEFTETNEIDALPIAIAGFPSPPAICALGAEKLILARTSRSLYAWNLNTHAFWPRNQASSILEIASNRNASHLSVADEAKLGAIVCNSGKCYLLLDSGVRASAVSTRLLDTHLAGIDLEREGAMISGFPVTAAELLAEDSNAESYSFVGSPLALTDQLVVLMVDLRGSQNKYRLASINPTSGELQWVSDVFGTSAPTRSSPTGSAPCILFHQGRLFVATGNGSINAISAGNGDILYQVNYTAPAASRDSYSELLPTSASSHLAVKGQKLICQPSDCLSLFAIDWGTGEVLWVADAAAMKRSPQMTTVTSDSIICIGDRIQCFSLFDGALESAINLPRVAANTQLNAVLVTNSLVWSNSERMFQFTLKDLPEPGKLTSIEPSQLIQSSLRFRQPFAFAMDRDVLSVVTNNSWHVTEAADNAATR